MLTIPIFGDAVSPTTTDYYLHPGITIITLSILHLFANYWFTVLGPVILKILFIIILNRQVKLFHPRILFPMIIIVLGQVVVLSWSFSPKMDHFKKIQFFTDLFHEISFTHQYYQAIGKS